MGDVKRNEEDWRLVIFFYTILFFHYLKKYLTPFVDIVLPNVQLHIFQR